MAGRIAAEVSSRVVPDAETPAAFALEQEGGAVLVRGQVSAGRRGWTLFAAAHRRRRRLLVQITARQARPDPVPALEQHEYRVVLSNVPAGRYDVFLSHVFLVDGVAAPAEPRYLGPVRIPG